MAQQEQVLDASTRETINEEAITQFFASWDPGWRWLLVLGIRDMRANLHRLGELAASATGDSEWEDESYAYGPLALGLTAAAVNETAQHCEDLFALLRFLRERTEFVKRMTSYSAGQVTGFGASLADTTNEEIRKLFLMPDKNAVVAGMAKAEDSAAAIAAVETGVDRLVALIRGVVDWYLRYQFFHVQYKHGLKVPLRPVGSGPLPAATVEQRKENVKAPLIAYTNEPLAAFLKRPPGQQAIIIPSATPTIAPHLNELMRDRALLRYQMSGPEVDLDDVVEISFTVLRLLRIARANRLSVSHGLNNDSQQVFQLPGESDNETVRATLDLATPAKLEDFD